MNSYPHTPLLLTIAGMLDGTVQFYSVRTGKMVLAYQAHDSKVRSLQLISTEEMFTGGHDGSVRLWNLGGNNDMKQQASIEMRPARVIDFFFKDALPDPGTSAEQSSRVGSGGTNTAISQGGMTVEASQEPEGVIKAYRFDDSRESSPVVALQADDNKLVTASEDGDKRHII